MNETLPSEQHNAAERAVPPHPEHAAEAEDAKQGNPRFSEKRRAPECASSGKPEIASDAENARQANPASSPFASNPLGKERKPYP